MSALDSIKKHPHNSDMRRRPLESVGNKSHLLSHQTPPQKTPDKAVSYITPQVASEHIYRQQISSPKHSYSTQKNHFSNQFSPKAFFSRAKDFGKIVGVVLATFGLTLASSLAMAHINQQSQPDPIQNTLAVASTDSGNTNSGTNGLAVTMSPDLPAFSSTVITDPNAIYLPIEKEDVPDPLSQRKAFLEAYLKSKNSPLAAHVDALSDQTQWKLIIAIADAESSYCKRKELNNCWGIGGAWNLKAYDNYDQAIADVNRILEQHYIAAGLTSPDTIENKWVGHPNDNWETAADQVMDDLKNVQ
jgi:hypothetical protein